MAKLRKYSDFFFENSLFLILGTVTGLIWANLHSESYSHLAHLKLFANDLIGYPEDGRRIVNLHYLVNDILMAFFFAIAGKEVWEAMLPGGHLRNPRQAAVPLLAAVGGMTGPALFFLIGAIMLGRLPEYGRGWAIPCATDIAFSYLAARLIFGRRHPAIPFLLLLAIADDAMGLLILAVFYPQEELRLVWLTLALLSVVIALGFRRMRLHSLWWYLLIPGSLSWFAFALSGLHPALGLLPIIPTLPHEHVSPKAFNWEQLKINNTLARFEEWWRNPVEIILGLFGFLNAGVQFSAIGAPTWLVFGGLLVGKPLGIWLMALTAAKVLRVQLKANVRSMELFVVGCLAGIGFTVALFVATVAYPAGPVQDAAKMGALLSFAAAIPAYVAAKALGVKKMEVEAGDEV